MIVGAALLGAALFAAAGTVSWWNGWAFIGIIAALGVLSARAVARSPGLAYERRTAAARAPAWDRAAVRLVSLALPVVVVLAGLDRRFGWLPDVPRPVPALAILAIVPAVALAYRSMVENPFFSSHVRIQAERGHTVVETGPYAAIRHPGYAGTAVFNLAAPLALGSWVALVPGLAAVAVLIWRTAREDALLQRELPGYAAYATAVRSRLVPGIW
ncbi:MAG: isoprenylcysteine carboxylmethyltransferase family protein [Gemmatimonadota bacterium]